MADKTMVITGASGGIGTALATRMSAQGWLLHLIDVAKAPLEALAARLPGKTNFAVSTLDSPEACASALPTGEIHALVHLAGIFVAHEIGAQSTQIARETMQHNATNAYDLAGAAVPQMERGSAMVFASSLAFTRGAPDHPAYAMAKGALVGLTRALSRKLGGQGIRVNAVAPGIIETPMTDDLIATRGRDNILATIPLGRLGSAAEVASVIAFLTSDDAAYMTGQLINVDGGIVNG